MLRAKTAVVAILTILMVTASAFFRPQTDAATSKTNQPRAAKQPERNKFVGRWASRVTLATGEEIDEGIINVTEVNPRSSDRVTIAHSRYGGSTTAYTMPYPDRIEIQMPLGDGRVVHYNGVLVSRKSIRGHVFIAGGEQNRETQQGYKRPALEEDNWTATSIPPP